MENSGAISLTGSTITVIGKDAVASPAPRPMWRDGGSKFGTGNQTIATNPRKSAISGAAINSSANGMHEITGAVVKIN